jgi:hypothetical protein
VNNVKDDGSKLADWVDQTAVAYLRTSYQTGIDEWNRCRKEVEQCAPPPGELLQYGAPKQPWNSDVSSRTIGGRRASHQAYEKDISWWRYDSGARKSTYVTNYQWRAPGEWFAELYAFSWLKKIEPPTSVAGSVRPYMFGGHVAPPGG